MLFKEIEFKYDANCISLTDFSNVLEKMNPSKNIYVSSYDDYYTNAEGHFIRYRYNNESQELTIKRKLKNNDNVERTEVNLPIKLDNMDNKNSIKMFIELLGYKQNFSIYKVCKIYWINNVVISYYIVYNNNMIELNRFIEIEANEHCNFNNEEDAFNIIKKYEDKLKELGIYCKKRLKRSLFELYKVN